MIEFVRNKDYILDLGCNTGRGGEEIKIKYPGSILDGVDIVQERIDRIPSGIYRNLFCNSVERVDFDGLKYDAIIGGEFAEHIPINLLKEMLHLFKTILKPGGQIVLTTPNPDYLLVKLGRDGVIRDPSHVNIMSHKVFRKLIEEAGFKNIQIKGTGRVSSVIGSSFPILSFYGSYMVLAEPDTD